MARRLALPDASRELFPSNPFVFMQFRTLLRNGALATSFLSITSALFFTPSTCEGPMQWRGEVTHASMHSPLFPIPFQVPSALSPVFATDPRNCQLITLFATHPKTGLRKSFACHTCDTPRGVWVVSSPVASLFSASCATSALRRPAPLRRLDARNSGARRCRDFLGPRPTPGQ